MAYAQVSLRVSEWPAGDRQRWLEVTAPTDPLSEPGRASHWKASTRMQVAKDYGRFLGFVAREGRLQDGDRPSVRLDRELPAYLLHLQGTAMATTSLLSRLRNLRQAIQAMDPYGDIRRISLVCNRLKRIAEPRRDKADKVVPASDLADAATRELDLLLRHDELTPRMNHRARDALMMLVLAHVPLRLANFAGLRLGRHFVRRPEGYHLNLDGAEQKAGRDFDLVLPAALTIYLDFYVNRIRPCLLHGKMNDQLWISTRGTAMSESTVYYQINRATTRLIGRRLNPHAFRDCVMTTLATEAPASVQAGARLLGHRDLRTGEQHYNFATSLSAQRQYHEVLHTLRARALADEELP